MVRESEYFYKGLYLSEEEAQTQRRWMKILIAVQILVSFGWTLTECFGKLELVPVKIAFYVYLGLIIQPVLAACYISIMIRLKRYFKQVERSSNIRLTEMAVAHYKETDK